MRDGARLQGAPNAHVEKVIRPKTLDQIIESKTLLNQQQFDAFGQAARNAGGYTTGVNANASPNVKYVSAQSGQPRSVTYTADSLIKQ